MKLDDYRRARDKIMHQGPVYNPIKENLKKGFRFLKLFWAILVLAIVITLLYFFGDRLGIELW